MKFFWTAVVVADSCRLGEVSQGWQVAMHALTAERFKRLNTRMPSMMSVLQLSQECELHGEKAIEKDSVRQYSGQLLGEQMCTGTFHVTDVDCTGAG